MIKLENLYFSYHTEPTLSDVSLNVKDGEWLGILGPNGSGKTTLIKILAGILHKKAGTYKILGRSVDEFSKTELARIIAVVPQDSNFTFPFSALEIVIMGRAPHLKHFGFETAKDIEVARKAMETTDTWQFKDRPINSLSGGERQRVIIARALAQEPKVLLLDEPTTFLDLRHQSDIMKLILRQVEGANISVISALHDLNLATLCCSKIVLLKNGRFASSGAPHEVITYSNIKNVFETDVYVGQNDITNRPYYVPMIEKTNL